MRCLREALRGSESRSYLVLDQPARSNANGARLIDAHGFQ